MHKILLLALIGLGTLLAFTGYCVVLTDWIQDISGGIYQKNYVETALETAGLGIYTFLGIRFFSRNLGSFR